MQLPGWGWLACGDDVTLRQPPGPGRGSEEAMSTETRPDYSMWVTCAEGDCDQGHRTDCKDLRERAAAVAKQEAEPWRCAEHGGWPYDADRNDPLAALRIPVVSSPYPGWKYEVAEQLLDHIHLYGAWKAAHPEAFPVSSEGGQES